MNASKLAIPALCVGLLGVVGGVAVSQAFKPVDKPTPVVNIAPAAETGEPTVTVTPSPTTTTAAPKPAATTTAPKPAATTATAPKPVTSKKSSTPKASTVQRQAIVSEQPANPTPEQPAPTRTPGERTVKGNPVGPTGVVVYPLDPPTKKG